MKCTLHIAGQHNVPRRTQKLKLILACRKHGQARCVAQLVAGRGVRAGTTGAWAKTSLEKVANPTALGLAHVL